MKFLLSALFCMGLVLSSSIANAESKSEGAEGEVQFVELMPLLLPIIDEHGGTQMVSLVVAVEVDSQENADKVTKYSPRLTDAYLSDLYGALSNKDGIVPIPYLKQRLNKMSAKVLGEHVVNDVLVQVMQSRRT